MSALMLTTQLLVSAATVVAVTPLWPNLVEIPEDPGCGRQCVPPSSAAQGGRSRPAVANWPGARRHINSDNPTGWTIGAEEQQSCSPVPAPWDLDRLRRRVRTALLRQVSGSRGTVALDLADPKIGLSARTRSPNPG
jgi:hypothetical protein